MAEREERRFVELPRESVRLMAESAGLELSDEVAALLAEDVCYRLREATQNSSQFMKHTRRRKLTVEDFNRALRWSNVEAVCGYGSQDALPFRAIKEGELYFQEDREVNLVELALATNIPKGCAETAVRVHVSYLDGKGNLEPQGAGEDPQRRLHADGRPAQVLPARHPGGAGRRPPVNEGGPAGPADQLQDRRPPALLRLRGQRGEIREPRPGAAEPAAAHRTEPDPEPLPLPGLLRAQPRRQRHVLRPGALGRLHQPPQRPLDAAGLRRHAAQPRLLDPRRPGERPVPPDPALPAEGAGRPRAAALLPLRRRGGAARAGLAGGGAGAVPPPPHLLGQPAGRAGRLLRLQRPGQGRRTQGLRRHLGGCGAAAEDEGSADAGVRHQPAAGGFPAAQPPTGAPPRARPRPGPSPAAAGGGRGPPGVLPPRLAHPLPPRHVPRALRLLRRQFGHPFRHRVATGRHPPTQHPRRDPEGTGSGFRRRGGDAKDAPTDGQRHGEPAGGGEPALRAPGRPPGASPAGQLATAPGRSPPARWPPSRRSGGLPEMPFCSAGRPAFQLHYRGSSGRPALPRADVPDQFPATSRTGACLPIRPKIAHDRPNGPAGSEMATRRVFPPSPPLSRLLRVPEPRLCLPPAASDRCIPRHVGPWLPLAAVASSGQ